MTRNPDGLQVRSGLDLDMQAAVLAQPRPADLAIDAKGEFIYVGCEGDDPAEMAAEIRPEQTNTGSEAVSQVAETSENLNGAVIVIRLKDLVTVRRIACDAGIRRMKISTSGKYLYLLRPEASRLDVLEIQPGRIRMSLDIGDQARDMVLTADGSQLLISRWEAKKIMVVETGRFR